MYPYAKLCDWTKFEVFILRNTLAAKVTESNTGGAEHNFGEAEEPFGKVEQRPRIVINQTLDGAGHAAVTVRKPNTFKILNFDETGSWSCRKRCKFALPFCFWTILKHQISQLGKFFRS